MEKRKFDSVLRRAVGLPIIAMAVFAPLLLWEIRSLRISLTLGDHIDQVIADDNELHRLILDMETGIRGYQVNAKAEFLEPYIKAEPIIDAKFSKIEQLISDDPAQHARLAAIRTSFDEWRQLANHSLELFSKGTKNGEPEKNTLADNEHLKQLMDSIRSKNAAFAAAELELQRSSLQRASRTSRLAIITCTILVLTGSCAFALFIRRPMRILGSDFKLSLETAEAHSEELRDQAELLELAYDTITVRDLEGKIRFWNHGAELMYGYTKQQAIGLGSQDLLCTVLQEPLAQIEEKLHRDGCWEGELQRTVQDGTRIVVSSRWVTQRDKNGAARGVMEIGSNITERKRTEEAFRISKERLSAIISMAMDAVITLDEKQHIVLFNTAAEKMFACLAKDAIGQSLGRFIPTNVLEDHSRDGEDAGNIETNGESIHHPEMFRGLQVNYGIRTNGEKFPVEGTISQIIVAGERLYTFILRDITQRMQSEVELREKEERFKSMFEHAAVGIAQVAMDGGYLMVNRALCGMLGYSESELLTKTAEGMTHPEDWIRESELRISALSSNHDFYELEKRYIHRNGAAVWVNATSSFVKDNNGRDLYSITVIQELTRRKGAEDQLRQAQKMEAIGRLAGGVAHDFNNLLTVILGYSELALADLPAGDPNRDRFQEIERSAEIAAALTKQLLAFSRNQIIAKQVVDLNEIVTEMEPMLRRLLPEDIEIVIHCGQDACPVDADPGQLKQILINLAVNAGDAMRQGGTLTIAVRTVEIANEGGNNELLKPGPSEMLSVSDTGSGMDTETIAHIFEPFFTTKPVGDGTGLGLATLYGIVQEYGGKVLVSSVPGAGSVFNVHLPRSSGDLTANRNINRSPQAFTGSETILLVDDSEPLRKMMRGILVQEGYKVLDAANGALAWEIAKEYPGIIHLLITDIVMPHMGGIELAEHVILQRPDIGLIFVSGYAPGKYAAPFHTAGRTANVQKPYKTSEFLGVVRQMLDAMSLP